MLCFDQVCKHISGFVKDPSKAIFVLGMSPEWNDKFKSSVNKQDVQFVSLECATEGAAYYKLLKELLDVCVQRSVSYLVDGQSAQAVSLKAINQITQGNMHQAIQLTKESIQTEREIQSQVDQANLKVGNLKFEAPDHVVLLRPLVHLGED